MKKTVTWILALLLILNAANAFATQPEAIQAITVTPVEPVDDPIGVQRGTMIVVGSTTEMNGYFSTDMWGTNTSDMDVRTLLHGYSTVIFAQSLGVAVDGVPVAGVTATAEADGSRTYVFTLNENLVYNDGTPITAKDYVFSLLLTGSPEISQIGGVQRGMDQFVGFEAYRSGATGVFSGIRLLSDYSFSLQIAPEYVNYYYGMAMLSVTPYPLRVIAPGCDILDDGNGAYIGRGADAGGLNAAQLGFQPGMYSADMLRVTMMDPKTGYLFNPRVTSGPYSLESYDAVNHVATLRINERYLGNFEGQRPHIEQIVFQSVKNEEMVEQLTSGEVNLLNKVVNQTAYQELNTAAIEGKIAQPENYPRSGFAFLAFACEQGATASAAVRNAVARCIDKDVFLAENFLPTTAMAVQGYYGLGQQVVTENFPADPEKGLDELSVLDAVSGFAQPKDLDLAKKLLVDDGWTLNEKGEPFAEGTDLVRYRKSGNSVEPLLIKWAKTEGNSVADALEAALKEPFAALGIDLQVTVLPFAEILPYYYRQTERTYNMFFLASNFTYLFDPYYDFNTDNAYQGLVNTSGLRDKALLDLTEDMRKTDAQETREYADKWLAFQQRWVELMPMVPLYSNIYFDFFSSNLQGYDVPLFSGWGLAIPYAYIADEPIELPTLLGVNP